MGNCCEKKNIIIKKITFNKFFEDEHLDEIQIISQNQNGKSKYIINFKPIPSQKIKLTIFHSAIKINTNSESIEIINKGNFFPFIYNTDIQLPGKGNERNWAGCIKGNVYTTTCIPFHMIIDDINDNNIIVKVVSISIYEILSEYINDKIFLKYPNNILCKDKKKIGGIIVEDYKKFILILFGLNIVDKPAMDKIGNNEIYPCFLKEHMKNNIEVPSALKISIDITKKIFYNLNLSGDEIFELYNKYAIRKHVKV